MINPRDPLSGAVLEGENRDVVGNLIFAGKDEAERRRIAVDTKHCQVDLGVVSQKSCGECVHIPTDRRGG